MCCIHRIDVSPELLCDEQIKSYTIYGGFKNEYKV